MTWLVVSMWASVCIAWATFIVLAHVREMRKMEFDWERKRIELRELADEKIHQRWIETERVKRELEAPPASEYLRIKEAQAREAEANKEVAKHNKETAKYNERMTELGYLRRGY